MKSQIRLIWFLAIISFIAINYINAAAISLKEAENIAKNWMQKKTNKYYSVHNKSYLNSSMKINKIKRNSKNYAIIQLNPQGWVIVSLDDSTRPVLAYGLSSMDSKLPPSFSQWLKATDQYITEMKYNKKSQNKYAKQWRILNKPESYLYSSGRKVFKKNILYANGDTDYVVRPLLWMNGETDTEEQGIRWNQGRYYNNNTPIDSDSGNHTWTGCVATAMGQIMRYWKYPNQGRGEHSYTPRTHPEYGEQYANFESTIYNWENMPFVLDSDNDDIAMVLYHAGVSVDMDYAPESSGAWHGSSMKKYFGYQLMQNVDVSEMDVNSSWIEDLIMHELLDKNIPVMASGLSEASGHLYVIDGYDMDGYYHHNWGWGGGYNGKFTLDNEKYILRSVTIVAPHDPTAPIDIGDMNLSECVVEKLGIDSADEIGKLSVKYISFLDCKSKGIVSVNKLLGHMNYLVNLLVDDNNITGDINLSGKPRLSYINLSSNNISSINLDGTDMIEKLYAHDNNLTGEFNLSNLHNLSSVHLDSNVLSRVILPTINRSLSVVDISYNPINILEMDTLRNVEDLYAYGFDIGCWERNSLSFENNITTIHTICVKSPDEELDTDSDGISNLEDYDDDGDDIYDLQDDDIDGDGVANNHDAYPLNKDKFLMEVSEVNASKNTVNRVHISWNSVKDANYYKVLRYDARELNSTYREFTTNNAQTTYDDTSISEVGRGYYYRVKACNDIGCSALSDYVDAYGKTLFDVNATDGLFNGKVKVYFTANNSTTYSLSRSSPGGNASYNVASGTTSPLVDESVENGVNYEYFVSYTASNGRWITSNTDIGYALANGGDDLDGGSSDGAGSSGGGCTYNPNANGFDAGLMLMLFFSVIYPFRRRLYLFR